MSIPPYVYPTTQKTREPHIADTMWLCLWKLRKKWMATLLSGHFVSNVRSKETVSID